MLTKRCTLLLIIVSVALTACDNRAEFAALQEQAAALVEKYAPPVKELEDRVSGLTGKLRTFPSEIDGVGDFAAQLRGAKESLASMSTLLDSTQAVVDEALTSEKPGDLKAFLYQLKLEVGDKLAGFTATVGESERTFVLLEAKAKEAPPKPAVPARFTKELPGGYSLEGAADGVERMLVAMIEDANRPVDKTTWFKFDRLVFESGKSSLDMKQSEAQLKNVSEILAAYPKIKLKIGGYTDSTGSKRANKKISRKRAKAVKAALTKMGSKAKRIKTEGYGPADPVCEANDTDECKAKNRRIAVRLTAK